MLIKDGYIVNYKINRSVIKSRKRYTYDQAMEIIENKRKSSYEKEIKWLANLCKIIKNRRKKNGWIENYRNKVFIKKIDNKYSLIKENNNISHQMVEQAMILTNYIIAYDLNKKLKTVPYRIHSSKNTDDSFDILRKSIKKIETKVPKKITSDYLKII